MSNLATANIQIGRYCYGPPSHNQSDSIGPNSRALSLSHRMIERLIKATRRIALFYV
jgi:hypothetical protein